jgi:hypothetical protein
MLWSARRSWRISRETSETAIFPPISRRGNRKLASFLIGSIG